MSSNPCNLHGLRDGDHKTADQGCACGCLAVRLQARVCGLSLQPIGCTSALVCDVERYCSCSCRLRRYISVMPLPFTFLHVLFIPREIHTRQCRCIVFTPFRCHLIVTFRQWQWQDSDNRRRTWDRPWSRGADETLNVQPTWCTEDSPAVLRRRKGPSRAEEFDRTCHRRQVTRSATTQLHSPTSIVTIPSIFIPFFTPGRHVPEEV